MIVEFWIRFQCGFRLPSDFLTTSDLLEPMKAPTQWAFGSRPNLYDDRGVHL